jgi:hypothetical protein
VCFCHHYAIDHHALPVPELLELSAADFVQFRCNVYKAHYDDKSLDDFHITLGNVNTSVNEQHNETSTLSVSPSSVIDVLPDASATEDVAKDDSNTRMINLLPYFDLSSGTNQEHSTIHQLSESYCPTLYAFIPTAL